MTSTPIETLILYLLLLLGVLFTIVAAIRARNVPLRAINGYTAMPLAVGEAVEADKAVHVSFGSSAIREESTLTALASAEVLYHIAERAAIGDRPTIVTLSDPVTLGIAQDTLRRAYKARRILNKYRPTLARWYPQGPLSLAFAAGVGAAMLDEDVSANIAVGRFGSELMLLAENAVRYDRLMIAHSDRLEGQAVAYVVSDTPLIGEELYVGSAYLGRTPLGIGGAVALDVLRYVTLGGIILAALYSFITGGR